jgi:hypothetical protein
MLSNHGKPAMTLLLTVLTMIAFAATYACVAAMIGERFEALTLALRGVPQRRRPIQAAVSRRLSLA